MDSGSGCPVEPAPYVPDNTASKMQNHRGLYVVMENDDVDVYSLPWKDACNNRGKNQGRKWKKSYFLQKVRN